MKPINMKAVFDQESALEKKYSDEYIEEHYKGKADKVNAALTSILDEVQNKCTARCIGIRQIYYMLDDVIRYLGISKKSMDGITVVCDYHAQNFPNAYKYIPMSTHIKAEFKSGSWRVTDIYRDECKHPEIVINHTEASKAALIEKYSQLR